MPGAPTDPKRTYSESQIPTNNNITPLLTVYTTPLIRKKSGEVVKSSLKSPSVSSFGSSRGSSRPPTPIFERSVRFDGQLEHVKLFHKEQKPAAVSREGSPYGSETSDNDTPGRQSDANYRSSEDERIRSGLVLETVNIPLRNAMASTQERLGDLDVRLEQVKLSQDGRNVEGTVLVRNIAFEKWIAVRFTYDWWQTTSEVTAKYASSFADENTDLFSFAIRLPDVTKRIEEKRLFFALRYTVAGKESWDNNRGENYQLRFKTASKSKPQQQQVSPSPSSKFPPSWPVKTANVDQMADLRKELERVVREDEESSGLSSWDVLTAKLRAKNMDLEEDRDAKKTLSLRSRYDFGASSKVKWEPPTELPRYNGPPPETAGIPFPTLRQGHAKAASFSGVVSPPVQGSWRSPRGSPRDHGNESTPPSPKFFIDPRDAKHWGGPSPQTAQKSVPRTRNHQRGGYFDTWADSNAVMTPTTPIKEESTEMTASTSVDSCATVVPGQTTSPVIPDSPSVLVNDENVEISESESTDSTSSSSVTGASAADASIGLGIEQARAMRFNSYPMDRTYLTAATAGSTPETTSPSGGVSTLAVPAASWSPQVISPQGSLSSITSTPSFTSASSPSQCPSSPSELSDSLRAINQPGAHRPSLDSLDYGYFLRKFCYYTGHDIQDRHNVNGSYGSAHHRHSISESTMDGHAAGWQNDSSAVTTPSNRRYSLDHGSEEYKRPAFITRVSQDETASWSGESGHTTPTRATTPLDSNSPGKRTPRAGSPVDLESTPRISESFIRPVRGSL